MNQDERDKILLSIDSSGYYSNEKLFLAELTPYYNFSDSNNRSFIDKVLEYKKEINLMLHNTRISFTPDQKKIFDILNNKSGGKYAISATTSFGKTTIVKEYIKKRQPKTVVYVVPTNSLADELLTSFQALFTEDGYIVIDTSIKKTKQSQKIIFVGTQEKLKEISWLSEMKIELFVIDEAYKLSDEINGFREIILNRIFLDFLKKSKTYILLLPLVNEIKGLKKLGFEVLKTDYSPVTKQYFEIPSEKFDNEITRSILQSQEKNLVYFSSPSSLEKFYKDNLQSNSNRNEDDWIRRVENDFHPEWFPVKAYKLGLAIHYGPMPKFFQMKMVHLFNSTANFNTILSTSSLIEGINTPTKNIYIKDSNIFEPHNRIKYKNLVGRAGRLGTSPVGKIFFSSKDKNLYENANLDWKSTNISIIVDNDDTVIDINRSKTKEYKKKVEKFAKKYNLKTKQVTEIIEKYCIKLTDLENLIKKIQNYEKYNKQSIYEPTVPDIFYFFSMCYYSQSKLLSITINENDWKTVLQKTDLKKEEAKKKQKNLKYNFTKKLLSATINTSISFKNLDSISNMLEYLNESIEIEFYDTNDSEIISKIIEMIYSVLPYELIPFVELVLNMNEVLAKKDFQLLSDKTFKTLDLVYKKYNIRYFGNTECSIKERKIIRKMFEYGIPYHKIKKHISYFVKEIPDSFSILDIKKAIEKKLEVKNDLDKYFIY